MTVPLLAPPLSAAFHRERSHLLDAFAECEEAVTGILRSLTLRSTSEPFGSRVASLAKAEPSPSYAKARKQRVDALLAQVCELLPLRADIVHARLQVLQVDGVSTACFVNSRQHGDPFPTARLIAFDAMRDLTRRVAKIAQDLRQQAQPPAISPASSPPPPSPGAAGDP